MIGVIDEIPRHRLTARTSETGRTMNRDRTTADASIAHRLRQILLELARREDELAARVAAALPYWAACPPSVPGHRAAASALRAEADHFLAAAAS